MKRTTTRDDVDDVIYVTPHEPQQYEEDLVEQDAAIVEAVIRAIRQSPKLHAELVIALEHKV